MRGILMWALIVVVIVIILLVAFSRFWVGSVDETTRVLASTQASHIAGIINTLQTAPDKTEHIYELPQAECKVTITRSAVHVTARSDREQAFTVPLMISDVGLDEKNIECSEEEAQAIKFVKNEGHIEITQLPVS